MTERRLVNAWLSLGSNLAPEIHIPTALRELERLFGDLRISPIYESRSIGFEGANFHNLVVGILTDHSPRELVAELREVEKRHGRERTPEKFSPRTLDIDLLTYGEQILDDGPIQLPRDEIRKYAFVLLPLSEVAGDEIEPRSGRTYSQLWESFEGQDQDLWRLAGGSGL
ncbi:MAG: 2-amino-4-hydroxy-6-hydroxymethyldihydropteridine diphosphokinase [Candidatus Thiodiazotropha sp. (ex Ctena orbiculata)]|uniref:2-amino-4-hydroxy-6-hydroxymethyldihydropteridine diphosphokinase n=1 Tax=Candidatus Thiodiazotropha taylori TaxID=2792791 RepID=A0A944M4E4_9GAMM|nr:2-amino-4-hydroxy-6-hydroxymethyldihydropteridine diphosphokinase [Candidatus Thiodiazotropha taylori]PUB86673.1 MAG: 2-amino-4-hydroxy-6-hydroxymethyldihydropteridine diphosphokinase [gamma proteobacterium symbiont of Ctena orbiculata]MBT2987821.1 2-amino-4-hydroxy-6-hydroxymethyldihydropteridine diphosphokinase [Candidatus Thiodiazotropha taylori]MBT2995792.1 2-amino-4-hydroxy-6-hydroxymethyldihydropteridine diphosphokinase [Candidatus Thiodiazotropha taylori]MBT2999107.1 2-amino-4-hydroxy